MSTKKTNKNNPQWTTPPVGILLPFPPSLDLGWPGTRLNQWTTVEGHYQPQTKVFRSPGNFWLGTFGVLGCQVRRPAALWQRPHGGATWRTGGLASPAHPGGSRKFHAKWLRDQVHERCRVRPPAGLPAEPSQPTQL